MNSGHLLALLSIGLVLIAALAATRVAIAYGLSRKLIDLPGGRRLHSQPTVRGAGVGIVCVLLVSFGLATGLIPEQRAAALGMLLALGLVAAIGWWDDHRPLPARWRLLAHLAAVMGLLFALGMPLGLTWLLFAVALLWLVNAYNFIDGSDGFASAHCAWISGCCALVSWQVGDHWLAMACAYLCAACCGFLYFNWPPARAFLGDVASGTLGLALGCIVLLSWERASLDPLLPILLMSGVVLDASLTLLWRMLSGRRWYQAHCSHLYQWMLRSGWSAREVLAAYLSWSLLAAACFWLLPESALPRLLGAAAVLAVGSGLWGIGRRRILRHKRTAG